METANLAETRARELVVQCCERNGVPVLTLTLVPTLTLTLTLILTLTLTLTLILTLTLTLTRRAGADARAGPARGGALHAPRQDGAGATYRRADGARRPGPRAAHERHD
eukprot:scaffold129766_cov69-Phaeocystis_antarctica.AAC.1